MRTDDIPTALKAHFIVLECNKRLVEHYQATPQHEMKVKSNHTNKKGGIWHWYVVNSKRQHGPLTEDIVGGMSL